MKLKFCLAVVVIFALSMINVFGQMSANPFQEGSAIIVNGTVASGKAGVNVTVVIPKAGVTVDDLKTKPLKDSVNYMNQTATAAGGAYRFEIMLSDDVTDNQILIRVGENNFAPVQEAAVNYIPTSQIIAAVQSVNNAYASGTTLQNRREKMEQALSSDFLGLETTGALSDYINLISKNIALDYMIEKVKNAAFPTSTDAELKNSVSSIRNYFKIGVGVATIDQANNPSVMDSALNRYSAALGIDIAEYNGLDGGNFAVDKTFVCTAMFPISVTNEASAEKALKAAMAVLKINKTISWDQVKNTLQNIAVDLGVDTGNGSRFNKIKDKNSFYKQYSDKIPFDSVQKAVNEFNAVVESVIDAEKIPSGGGNGGGGSGGGRASVVNTVIPVQPPQETEPSADKGFRDLANVPWAAEAIEALSRQGIINGVSANEFAPDNKVTRAEFLKMVICAFELPEIYENAMFSDISKDDWFYSYVEKAGKSGVVTGKPDGTFAPNENIQRQDMAVILMNVLKLSKINLQQVNSIQFRDENEINDYAKQSVYQLAFAGVISGKGDGYFAPEDSATRAEAAKIIYGLRR